MLNLKIAVKYFTFYSQPYYIYSVSLIILLIYYLYLFLIFYYPNFWLVLALCGALIIFFYFNKLAFDKT